MNEPATNPAHVPPVAPEEQGATGLLSLSLRSKLVLSYLAVALGAIVVLAIAVIAAVYNYYYTAQIRQLQDTAQTYARGIEDFYTYQLGGHWGPFSLRFPVPALLVIVDQSGHQLLCNPPAGFDSQFCSEAAITQSAAQALQGNEVDGHLESSGFKGLYVSVPLYDESSGSHQLIGALLIAQPEASPQRFLSNVTQAILLAGLLIGVAVIIFSLLLARRLTRPLESLTAAVERMKEGDYSQRVDPPPTQDELGRLAQTFNAMADRIEVDVAELRRQDQIRRDMIANIAHDLATPLTAIQGFSEALADEVIQEPGARKETAQLIAREVQRLRRLVADIQHMTLLESGRARLDLAPLDLAVLVDETLTVIEPECTQAGITLQNAIDPRMPPVLADSDRITQVLLNLIDNARRHTPAGGTITVGARHLGRMLEVWIRDTGVGIDPIDLPHIFERFYRADRARSGGRGGSGLGLTIVKAIVTAHGGAVAAESTPGKGTCIRFTLPLAPSQEEQGSPAGSKPGRDRREKSGKLLPPTWGYNT
ncbi:sensor histidine kinase [Thermogemmatispora onikobensis]|uniref:sensor histidine kinase n=1 Tax=Thermogemmatispora onikobensis TaxID=732234 RepID=UPI0008532E5E|nr:HAMP domain-containing sensor histidine kinase [Thermogemmatispora onikobensis]